MWQALKKHESWGGGSMVGWKKGIACVTVSDFAEKNI